MILKDKDENNIIADYQMIIKTLLNLNKYNNLNDDNIQINKTEIFENRNIN